MSCPEELAALADEDLLDFLKNGPPCPEISGEENNLLEDWGLAEPELLNKEMDDFISFLMSPFGDEPGTLQGYSPADSDSSISEDQNLSHSPGSDFAGSPQSSDIVQFDHNYSLHWDWPVLKSVRSEMAEEDVSIDLETWRGLEGTNEVLEQSSGFPIAVAVDTGHQLVPRATVQSDFSELVLTEEERQLLEKEGVSLSTCLPLTKAEEQLLKKVCGMIWNKQSAQDSHYRKMIYVDELENRVAACMAQNHELQKKVQLLQKKNMSLLEQLWKLHAFVRQSTTAITCIMVLVLSFCLILPPPPPPPVSTVWEQRALAQSSPLPGLTTWFGFAVSPQLPSVLLQRPTWGQGLRPRTVLELDLKFFPSCGLCGGPCSEQDRERLVCPAQGGNDKAGSTCLAVLSWEIHEFPNQVRLSAPDMQEEAVLERLSPEPEDPLLLGSLNQSWEEGQSPPKPNPRSAFNSNSSSNPPAVAGSKLGPPQPQEQFSQNDPLHAAVLAAWKTKKQEWVEHAASVVIQQHHADEM
ncbi:cyclic AMP-responsive element-binding protein 3-like protein 4 [Strix aluco]|uniref:cyclic AMP-responsive element-binding protein 3-like protein 4 n=1 Tax=Strix aluco TaxID=111821 RepID=UPI003DA2104F